MDYFLVIDAGTGSGKAILFDEKGHQIEFSQQEWRHLNLTGIPGSIDFDVNNNWQIIKNLIRETIKKSNINPKNIRAITATSMREGIVFYDKQGIEIWACSNVDARAQEEVEILKKKGLEKEIYNLTGQTFSISDVPRLLWIKRNLPDIYKKIHTLGMISDWVIFKLSGNFLVEPSNISTSGFFHTFEKKWSSEIIRELGFPTSIYPEVVNPGTKVGKIRKDLAEELELSSDTEIVIGGGDAQLGTIGVGGVEEFDTVILGGTFWQQEVNIKNPKPHPQSKIRINAHVVPELWQYEGISFWTGLVMRWFRDAFCKQEVKLAKDLGISAYSILSEEVKNVPPGSYGIMPIFSDVMNYIHWKHASPSILNFDINEPENYGKPQVFRALMENAGFISFGNLQEISNTIGFYPKEIIFAGGASNSPVWASILASILNVRVKVPKVKEATALGGMMCAAIGYGIYQNFISAKEAVVKIEAIYEPDKEEHEIYREIYEKWRHIYSHMLKLSDKGYLRHMWKSPGE